MLHMDRAPARLAANAISTATFSLTEYSKVMSASRATRAMVSPISDAGVPG